MSANTVSTGWTKINLDPIISQSVRKKKKGERKTKQTKKNKTTENNSKDKRSRKQKMKDRK